jgi:mono/diheme cytochrome c family protein
MASVLRFLACALLCGPLACKRGESAAPPEVRADELYRSNCASCHGLRGQGPSFAAPPGGGPPPPRDFTDPEFQRSRTDAELRRVIVEGKGAMPPFGRVFDEQELDLLVKKLRSFR